MDSQRVTKTSEGTVDVKRQRPARPFASPHPTLHPLHQLQQAFGNRALGRFIQTKLKVSQPGDAYEREADRVADQVMRMSTLDPLKGHSPTGPSPAPADLQQRRPERNNAARSPEVHLRDSQPAVRRFTDLEYQCTDFRGRCPEDSPDNLDSREATRRMMETAAGRWLISALRANDNLRSSRIISNFASNITQPEGGIFGSFHPAVVGASTYTASVDTNQHSSAPGTATPQPPESPLPAPVSTYGGGRVVIPTYIRERPSMLAETLFHELLHVWYLNTYSDLGLAHPDAPRWGVEPFTGHANAARGEIEAPFAERLRQFAVQIYRVETAPRAAAAQPATPATPATPPPRAQAPSPTATEPGGSRFSFRAGVDASYYRLPPASQGEFGLDFRLGFLYGRAIRFGASGDLLYVPRQGLVGVGGEVGVRVLQTEEHLGTTQIAENPMFFDINAGMVYMLRPGDPVIGSLGVGIGQEYGQQGSWAPFWRVGAALQASPTAAMNPFGFSAGLTVGVRR